MHVNLYPNSNPSPEGEIGALREGVSEVAPELSKADKVRKYLDGGDVRMDIEIDIMDIYDHKTAIDVDKITQGLKLLFEGFGLKASHIEIIPTDISSEEWRYLKKEITDKVEWDKCDYIAHVMEYDHYLVCLRRGE